MKGFKLISIILLVLCGLLPLNNSFAAPIPLDDATFEEYAAVYGTHESGSDDSAAESVYVVYGTSHASADVYSEYPPAGQVEMRLRGVGGSATVNIRYEFGIETLGGDDLPDMVPVVIRTSGLVRIIKRRSAYERNHGQAGYLGCWTLGCFQL